MSSGEASGPTTETLSCERAVKRSAAKAAPLWHSGLGPARCRRTGRLRQIQIRFAQAVDLKSEVVVLVGLTDPFHAYSPRRSDAAMIAWPHDGEDLTDTYICECLMGHRMTGFCAVAVTPQRRCNLPSDLEIGAAGRKRQQCHPPRSGRQMLYR